MDEAVKLARRVLSQQRAHPGALSILGDDALARGDNAAAIRHFAQAVKIDPVAKVLLNNLGVAQSRIAQFDSARDNFHKALALDPGYAEARQNLAAVLLRLGEWERGFREYEGRWGVEQATRFWRPFAARDNMWAMGDPAPSRLRLWGEQGIGDEILHLGGIPALLRMGGAVVVECDPRLVAPLARAMPNLAVCPRIDPPDARLIGEDCPHLPMASLPGRLWALGVGADRPIRYLEPDPQRVAEFRRQLQALGPGPYVGLSWRSKHATLGPVKSLPLDQWGEVLRRRDVTFVNLQYGDTDADVAAARMRHGAVIHSLPGLDRFNDMGGMLALVDALDLTLSTSNITAHLAGALGKECWLLLHHVPFWYWGWTGAAAPFYPSVTTFRQGAGGVWRGVMQAVGRRFADFIAMRRD
jgi:hypothetical protein